MSSRTVLVLLVALALIGGCGPAGESVKPPTKATAEVVKTTLEQVAQTGEVGSQVYAAKMAVTDSKDMDAAKAQALVKDFDVLLQTAGSPPRAKAKAAEMLKKL